MKIKGVTDEAIIFDNGNKITFNHESDCCELNWADFGVLNPNVFNYDYDFDEDLEFRPVEGLGFLFGCVRKEKVAASLGGYVDYVEHFIFIPCYSDQNGYYSIDIDIFYNNMLVIKGLGCFERSDW